MGDKSGPAVIGRVTETAAAKGRDYITPEDVSAARLALGRQLEFFAWKEVLQVLSRTYGWGAEDAPLCAFVAIQPYHDLLDSREKVGRPSEGEED